MPSLAIISGASRGFGRAVATSLASSDAPFFVLLARDAEGLAATCSAIDAVAPGTRVAVVLADLGDVSGIESVWERVLAAIPAEQYSHAVLVNNAGSVGPIGRVADLASDVRALEQSIALNVTRCARSRGMAAAAGVASSIGLSPFEFRRASLVCCWALGISLASPPPSQPDGIDVLLSSVCGEWSRRLCSAKRGCERVFPVRRCALCHCSHLLCRQGCA